MGHYRSEMISDEEYAKEQQDAIDRRAKIAANIREAIFKEGLDYVLADIIDNPTMAAIRYR